MKKRTGEPWIPAPEYGASLPTLCVNLIVRDIERSLAFYRTVLGAVVHYSDPDFAAIDLLGAALMLHADHAYDANPWASRLADGESRGLGAELRLLGVDPDEVEARANAVGALFKPVSVRGHGWREVMVEDPDGYVWAVGSLVTS
jgi:catechol 2,3-dioxygenase-like lactoylglutathione lyase family enzyme